MSDLPPMGQEDGSSDGHFVLVDGVGLHVVQEGEGKPLLLLHDFPLTHESFRGIRAALADGHRVLAVDLPGFGGSDRPPAFAYNVVAYADLLGTLLRQLDAAPAAALAHGFGAAVAVAMAVLVPGSLDRLVLVSPMLSSRPVSWLDGLAMRDGLFGEWLFRRRFTRERVAQRLRQTLHDPSVADADWLDRWWQPMTRPGGLDAARRVQAAMVDMDAVAELPPRLNCPTLLVGGDRDRRMPPERLHALAVEIPGARAVTVAECGTCPHEERSAEFLRAIGSFLDEKRA